MSEFDKEELRVMLVGRGGREHALAWKIDQSPRLEQMFAAPGSAAISEYANIIPIDLTLDNMERLADKAVEEEIDLVVVGPEDPLAWGLVDLCDARGIKAFGPNRAAAQLEASKIWAWEFGMRHNLPFPESFPANNIDEATKAVENFKSGEWVAKADELVLGKGVFRIVSKKGAYQALRGWMLEKKLGRTVERVLFQRFTPGQEVSAMAICSGEEYQLLPLAADHKAIYDGNKGPNTGGVGTYSPVGYAENYVPEIEQNIIERTLRGMALEGLPYTGLLYPGSVITDAGVKLYEFNVRGGDPETQVVLSRLKSESDLLLSMWAAVHHRLSSVPPLLVDDDQAAVCVVKVSGGYPGEYQTGYPIYGLDLVDNQTMVFHAGTKWDMPSQSYRTNGGRVIGVTSRGATLSEARFLAYANAGKIIFKDEYSRTDIAKS